MAREMDFHESPYEIKNTWECLELNFYQTQNMKSNKGISGKEKNLVVLKAFKATLNPKRGLEGDLKFRKGQYFQTMNKNLATFSYLQHYSFHVSICYYMTKQMFLGS